LESALARPRSGYYKCLTEQAAALLQSIACNHCFADGNKRLAFALTAVFLELNGFRLAVKPDDGEKFIIREVIVSHVDVANIAAWLEARMRKCPDKIERRKRPRS
jgi:death-on-curing protein